MLTCWLPRGWKEGQEHLSPMLTLRVPLETALGQDLEALLLTDSPHMEVLPTGHPRKAAEASVGA